MINRIAPFLIAAAVGAAASGVVVYQTGKRQQRAALADQEDQFKKETRERGSARDEAASQNAGKLHNAIKDRDRARAEATRLDAQLESLHAAKAMKLPIATTPAEVITALQNLDPKDDRTKRLSVHYFESLVFIGQPALGDIRAFLKKSVDLTIHRPISKGRGPFGDRARPGENDKERKKREEIQASGANHYFKPFPKPGNNFPPTLRLGLLEATANIGGEDAEQLLLDVLNNTLRGIEVAYLDIALEQVAPGKHTERVLEITRKILADMPRITEDADPLDKLTKGYLYAILVKHKDEIFIKTAQQLLIGADGRLDGHALGYIRQVLGERAMPILLAAYKDPRITNKWEKLAISDAALRFIGRNEQADAIFHEMVKDGIAEMKKKEFMDFSKYESLFLPVGSLMRDAHEQTPEVIGNRRKLLASVRKQSADPILYFGLSAMDKRLAEMQEKKDNPGQP
ncbi:MAG: hypothetical protein CMO66_04230 [Verrucomicrobiales bacterium]|nr:hypothetical protein [Verrucomicrobiales bacterium]